MGRTILIFLFSTGCKFSFYYAGFRLGSVVPYVLFSLALERPNWRQARGVYSGQHNSSTAQHAATRMLF